MDHAEPHAFSTNSGTTSVTLRPPRRRLAWTAALVLVLALSWACDPSEEARPAVDAPAVVAAVVGTTPTAPTPSQPAPATAVPTSVRAAVSPTVTAEPVATTPKPIPTPTPGVLAPTPTQTATPQPASRVAPELAALLVDMGPRLAAWRGLEPWDVPASLMTPEEFAVWLIAAFEEEYPADEAAADQLEWELLGLIRPEQNLYDLQLALYTEQVAGFYDSETEEIVVIGHQDAAAPMIIMTLAHEYVHALQDRAFDLDALEESVEGNQDALAALVALIEGDATVAELQYAMRELRREDFAGPESSAPPPDDVFSQTPPALQAVLLFPYVAGPPFVAALLDGGWRAVDAAYAQLPASTEQVLHPEKYVAREAPLEVDLPPLTDILPPGWSEVRRDVFGEFMVGVWLGGTQFASVAVEAAAGWGGDAYALYQHEDGQGLLTMKFRWDTERDLGEFWTSIVDHLVGGGLGAGASEVDATTAIWQGDRRTAHAQLLADSVLVVIGHDGAVVRSAAQFLSRG